MKFARFNRLIASCLFLLPPAVLSADAKSDAAKPVEILHMAGDVLWQSGGGTIWRYYEASQTETAITEAGKIVYVDPFNPRTGISDVERWDILTKTKKDAPSKYDLRETQKIISTPPPPQGWQSPEFDDSPWDRNLGPMRPVYHNIALMCARTRFQINDPAAAGDLSLTLYYVGGIVVYINGHEIARSDLPEGKIDPFTPAHQYPREAYINPDGSLIGRNDKYGNVMGAAEFCAAVKDPEIQNRYKLRQRALTAKIPSDLLKKGVNVLALEVHRAPADPVMFTTWKVVREYADMVPGQRASFWWDRVGVESLALTASGTADAVVANLSRPSGMHVWAQSTIDKIDARYFADPAESPPPLEFTGPRNGAYSRQLVVNSTNPIKHIKAEATELKSAGGQTLNCVQIRYVVPNGNNGLDMLEESSPADVASVEHPWGASVGPAILQPIWITVNIPKNSAPGHYTGTLTISADGEKSVQTPIGLTVVDWSLPDPNDFVTYMGIIQSPESVALQYNVPAWSDAHWKLLEKSFDRLAEVGDKQIVIPVCRSKVFGNRQSLVRWTRRPDGSYVCDCSLVEKYVDLAVRHLGKVPVVLCQVSDWQPKPCEEGFKFTEVDAAGETKDAVGPAPGTPEFRAFLKPAFDQIAKILANHGIAGSMMLSFHPQGYGLGGASPACVEDFKVIAPTARWARLGHYWFQGHDFIDKGPNGLPWGVVMLKAGAVGVFWDPDQDKPFHGWTNPNLLVAYPYCNNIDYAGQELGQFSPLSTYRNCAEGSLLSGRRTPIAGWGRGNIAGEFGYDAAPGVRGIGEIGADYWPVLKGEHSSASLYDAGGGWSTVGLPSWSILGAGKDGPVATVRSECMRQNLQEAEARVLIENTLSSDSAKTALGPDLARKAKALCDDRTRMLRNLSEYGSIDSNWLGQSEALYEMAAVVATKSPAK